MIELFFVACLASANCRDVSLLYDPREVSLMTCAIAGQAEIARWQGRNPDWSVRGWRCGYAGDRDIAA